jgi:hypothetical protein
MFVGHSVIPGLWERAAIVGVPPFRVQMTAGWHCPLLPLRIPLLQYSAIPVFAGVIWNQLPRDCKTGNDPVQETLVSYLPFTDDLLVGEVQLISSEVAGWVLMQHRVSVLPHGPRKVV